jgi:hypothetical protein
MGGSARTSVCVEQCVSAIGAAKVPVFLRVLSPSTTSVARIQVGCRQVTTEVLHDLCSLPYLAAAGGSAEVDTWPLIHAVAAIT